MALTEIEYGSLASSEIMNNNFRFLDNRISSVSSSLNSSNASINSNIATINSSITNISDKTNKEIKEILAELKTDNHLIETKISNLSGYRIWSDGFCEQWGIKNGCGDNVITFEKPFLDTNYIVLSGLFGNYSSDYDSSYCPFVHTSLKKTTSMTIRVANRNAFDRYGMYWFAFGIKK